MDEHEVVEQNQKRRSGFGMGLIIGLLAMAVILLGGTRLYCALQGRTLLVNGSGMKLVSANEILDEDALAKVETLASYIDFYYYEDFDTEQLQDAMYKGLVSGLDDAYSGYYTAEEYASLQASTSGTYVGIGAGLTQDADTMEVTISTVYAGTPAEEAGLLEGDQILSVNDIEATSVDVNELVAEIRGEAGTTAHMVIYRASTDEMLELDVERRDVELVSVSSQMLEGNIGYIEITEFQSKTAEQFDAAIEQLQDEECQSLIVDVRGNPGGMLDSVVDILDTLLPEGTVVYIEDKNGNRKDYTSDADYVDLPLVVLMDANSASASEIFAGAIKDYDRGTLVGTTTFGKGIVQTLYSLPDGDAIKLTTAKYFTPNGNYIHGVGITPDIELEYDYTGPDDGTYDMQYDNQLQRAIAILSE